MKLKVTFRRTDPKDCIFSFPVDLNFEISGDITEALMTAHKLIERQLQQQNASSFKDIISIESLDYGVIISRDKPAETKQL